MPAEQMTKVMPIASTPNTDVDRRILRKLETEKNTLDSVAMIAVSAARTSSDSMRKAALPAMRSRHDGAGRAEVVLVDIRLLVKGRQARRPPGICGPGQAASGLAAHFTYCSSGSFLASITSLVSTSVGT